MAARGNQSCKHKRRKEQPKEAVPEKTDQEVLESQLTQGAILHEQFLQDSMDLNIAWLEGPEALDKQLKDWIAKEKEKLRGIRTVPLSI